MVSRSGGGGGGSARVFFFGGGEGSTFLANIYRAYGPWNYVFSYINKNGAFSNPTT